MQGKIALLSMLLILGAINWSIFGKEKHLSEGAIVYLQLAPVDPRSLMQGDYMALRFGIGDQVYRALPKSENSSRWRRNTAGPDGLVVVALDEKNIATYQRIHNDQQPLSANEMLLKYRVRNGVVKFATNAFFFQEGQARVYQLARYGKFRVDNTGDLLLAAMYDKDLNMLEPETATKFQ
ncbi:MAG: GDYXXLXY domain-containing protein [Gammaproteobacteria bacterium]|nr:GDYXXLXY domain-containing protein [Gammaproteobacteria bacterium]